MSDKCGGISPGGELGCHRRCDHEGLCKHAYRDGILVEWCWDCFAWSCGHMDNPTKERVIANKLAYDVAFEEWKANLSGVLG